jgi:succinate dehydrogenase / fumarate reductase, cytochrome b subunit
MAVNTAPEPARLQRYRVRTGMFAWMAHRLSGVAIVVYLILHVWGLRALTDRDAFNELIASYHAPVFKVGEFMLLAAVVYHALNGFRIVLIDFLGWSPEHKKLFWTLLVLAVLIIAVGGYPSFYSLYHYFAG